MTKRYIAVSAAVLCLIMFVAGAYFLAFANSGDSASAKKPFKKRSWAETVTIDPAALYPVAEVLDGDTFKVEIRGHSITVRMLGIDTPETVDPRKGVQCYGPEASAESKALLTAHSVHIGLNPSYERVDKYGRLLAYVTRDDGMFVNEHMLIQGFAREYTFDAKKPYSKQSEFRDDEAMAKKEKRGLWGKCEDAQEPAYKAKSLNK